MSAAHRLEPSQLDDDVVLALDSATAQTFDAYGRLHVRTNRISKANVCSYIGREIPDFKQLGLDSNRIYRMYRDPAELERGAASFINQPLLVMHKAINADTHPRSITVGTIGSDVAFDGTYLNASLAVWDSQAIRLVRSKKLRHLSCGYGFRADMTPGTTPDGVAFDGVMRDITANHVALVESGRAGPDVIVSDSNPSEFLNMKRPALLAALLAALPSVVLTNEQQIAMDEALDAALAKQPSPQLDRVAMDAAIGAAITAGGYVSKAEAQALADTAAKGAVAHVEALHKAREDVKPLVGIVAMDSAEAVYRFALEKEKVDLTGVPAAAFPVLVDQVKQRKAASVSAAPKLPQIAADAALSIDNALPFLSAIQVQDAA